MRVHLLTASALALGLAVLCSCGSTEPQPQPQAQPAAKVETPAAIAPQAAAVEPGAPPSVPPSASLAAADKALVTVYREKRIVGLMLHTSVHVDGAEVAELENGAFVRLALGPGPHAFHADEAKDTIKLDLEAGKAYYFRMELAPGMWKGNGILRLVDEAAGAAEFKKWNLKLTKEIRKPELVVRDPGKP